MVICSDNYRANNGGSTVLGTITGICVRLRDKLPHG